MAPRVHNSGHWTIDGADTSQFENHLRAILGLPLGDTSAIGASAMLNLIGAHPPLEAMLAVPGARVHLYGKAPRKARKIRACEPGGAGRGVTRSAPRGNNSPRRQIRRRLAGASRNGS